MLQLRAYSVPAVPDAGHRRTRSGTENPQVLQFQTYITYFIVEIFVTFPSASPVLFSAPCATSFPEKAPTPSDCSRSLQQSIPLQLPEASDPLQARRYPEAAFLISKPEHRSVLRLQLTAMFHASDKGFLHDILRRSLIFGIFSYITHQFRRIAPV